jgi:ATP-dependent Clp protease adaptor protein ClpS
MTMGANIPGGREQTLTKMKPEVKPPSLYRVLMHNDDYTTMDFVVAVLESVFNKPALEAQRIMLQIHMNGIGVCGVYTAEVAETKIAIVHRTAREFGYPLKCTMEPE